jgi:membrane protein DedA with SNARE-associated domain
MFEALTDTAVGFVEQYGYVALFLFVVLETSWIIHFVPSEVVVPLAALVLVSGPTTFVLFVLVLWVGSIAGSVLAYELFGVRSERVLRRYGHLLYLPEEELEKAQAWVRRWGEGFMFWGRLVPVVRTPISIPAGIARMHRGRFLAYSAGGWLVYMTLLAALGYSDANTQSPLAYGWALAVQWIGAGLTAARETPLLTAVVVLGFVGLAALAWQERDRVV